VFDLIAIADDDRHKHRHCDQLRADVLDHVAFGPGPLSSGCATLRIVDHLFAVPGPVVSDCTIRLYHQAENQSKNDRKIKMLFQW
jgi:hypothetical protein